MNKLKILHCIDEELKSGKKVVLLAVAESSDSSPGRQGFWMCVKENGGTVGTIGGGVLEFKMTKRALDFLTQGVKSRVIVLHHDADADGEKSGLVCGGTQTLIFITLDNNDTPKIKKIIDAFERSFPTLITLTEAGLSVAEANNTNQKYTFKYSDKKRYEYRELVGIKETIFIVGGGHVGLALSQIMKFLNFHVVVFDERKDIFTLKENKFADNKIITAYKNIGAFIPEGDFSYVVIVTAKHVSDKEALKSVITKNVKYIGTMGSKKKIQIIFDSLKQEGIEDKLLEKVHSPIGLNISSETP